MDYLAQVQKGIDLIEVRLDTDIEPAEIARQAGISQWHFQRIFKALTNETLKTYIRSRRLANALDKLASTNERVLDIALTAGFESQESFTRAFSKAFGVPPADYRRRSTEFQFLRKVKFDQDYLRHINQNLSLEPEIYAQPEMRLVGLRTVFFSVDSEKNNMAAKLPGLWNDFLSRLGTVENQIGKLCYGVVRQTAGKTDELEYYAVTEVPSLEGMPPGMISITLPAQTYARFTHQGQIENLDRTVNYIYSTWLAGSSHQHTYGADIEFYGPGYQADSDQSLMHYAIPIHTAAQQQG